VVMRQTSRREPVVRIGKRCNLMSEYQISFGHSERLAAAMGEVWMLQKHL
jgi:hypothetical protein